jgi:hypothetical protein
MALCVPDSNAQAETGKLIFFGGLAATEGETEKATPVLESTKTSGVHCSYLVTVVDDFIVAAYKNGELIPTSKRTQLLNRSGVSAEKIEVDVGPDDWLVFNVVHNPLGSDGLQYFSVAGCLGLNEFGFVSDPGSTQWSICDDPKKAEAFIKRREAGVNERAVPIEKPLPDGEKLTKEFAGRDFNGKPLWGRATSTWIKFVAGGGTPAPKAETKAQDEGTSDKLGVQTPKQWPVQILSAVYGTAGKDADVTAKVKEYVETSRRAFSANPRDLGKDPNPFWNKRLTIVYMKDGIRREQRRNENEKVLPESFYGPQDAAELKAWLAESRWTGEKGEIQFHRDKTITGSALEGTPRWETLTARKIKWIWSVDHSVEFNFDHEWNSFSEVENGKNVFHILK